MSHASSAMLLGDGSLFDLLAPAAPAIDLSRHIPETLARLGRFCCQTSPVYSVAQHCVVGADALLVETGAADLALAFLLHDAHEAFIGDITTPAVNALAAIADEEFVKPGYAAGHIVRAAIASLKHRLDCAIYRAAGLGFPLPAGMAAAVRSMDRRLLAAEMRQLFPGGGRIASGLENGPPPLAPVPMRGGLAPWPFARAAEAWSDRLHLWRAGRLLDGRSHEAMPEALR